MQVQVNGRPRQAGLHDGQPFVQLDHGDTFAVLTLDGVNSFAFSQARRCDGGRLSRCFVVRDITLHGWHKDFDTVEEFRVTDFSNSAAAMVGRETGHGMLTLVVRAVWPAS